jgi:hypothetical protein
MIKQIITFQTEYRSYKIDYSELCSGICPLLLNWILYVHIDYCNNSNVLSINDFNAFIIWKKYLQSISKWGFLWEKC